MKLKPLLTIFIFVFALVILVAFCAGIDTAAETTALDSPLFKVPSRTPTAPSSPLLSPTPDTWITAGDSPLPTPVPPNSPLPLPTDDGIIFYAHDADPTPEPVPPQVLPESGGIIE